MRTLFVDPASNRTGWALFEDGKLIKSGTIVAPNVTTPARLSYIFSEYEALSLQYKVDEAFIERMNHVVSYVVVWSVGVIIAALQSGLCTNVRASKEDQISPSVWKSYVKRCPGIYSSVRQLTDSDDETVAVLMGLAHFEKKAAA